MGYTYRHDGVTATEELVRYISVAQTDRFTITERGEGSPQLGTMTWPCDGPPTFDLFQDPGRRAVDRLRGG